MVDIPVSVVRLFAVAESAAVKLKLDENIVLFLSNTEAPQSSGFCIKERLCGIPIASEFATRCLLPALPLKPLLICLAVNNQLHPLLASLVNLFFVLALPQHHVSDVTGSAVIAVSVFLLFVFMELVKRFNFVASGAFFGFHGV